MWMCELILRNFVQEEQHASLQQAEKHHPMYIFHQQPYAPLLFQHAAHTSDVEVKDKAAWRDTYESKSA